ncbi:MAG: hypothetical protein AAF850_06050 [Pseudomonadota bacterium]
MIGSPLDLLFEVLKNRLLGPKDRFERSKRRLTSSLLAPLIFVAGAPIAILGVFSSISMELNFGPAVLRFLGSSSSDFIVLAVVLAFSFAFGLGCNLYYSRHIQITQKETNEAEKQIRRRENFYRLNKKIRKHIKSGDKDRAVQYAKLTNMKYPDLVEEDSTSLEALIDAGFLNYHDEISSSTGDSLTYDNGKSLGVDPPIE